MTDRILKILDNVRYWETCPEDYKKDIETFLKAQSQALRIHDIVEQNEQLCEHHYIKKIDIGGEYTVCTKCGNNF